MMQTYLKTRPVWIQLLIFLGMAFGIFMVFSLIGVLILSSMTGISLMQLQDISKWDPNNSNMIAFIRGMLLVQFLGLFLVPSLLYSYFSDPRPLEYLGLRRPHSMHYWLLAIVVMILAIPLVEYLGLLNQNMSLGESTQKWMKSMEEEAAKQIQFMLHRHTLSELFLNLLFIAVFAGVGEELFFRGILQRLLIRAFKSPWPGIILTAIVFSGFHLQFFGFLPRLFLGIVLGAIYWYSGSLWPSIIAHFFYDGLIIVLAYLNPEMIRNPEKPMMNPGMLSLMAILSLVLVVLVLWQMKRKSRTSYEALYQNDRTPTDEFTF